MAAGILLTTAGRADERQTVEGKRVAASRTAHQGPAFKLQDDIVRNKNPKTLPVNHIAVERLLISDRGYAHKPSLVQLPSGELVVSIYWPHIQIPGVKFGTSFLYRSQDDGYTWSKGVPL